MGKGSGRRPSQVSAAHVRDEYERIFTKKEAVAETGPPDWARPFIAPSEYDDWQAAYVRVIRRALDYGDSMFSPMRTTWPVDVE